MYNFIKGLKYAFGPVRVTKRPLSISIRKRILHRGFELVSQALEMRSDFYEGDVVYTHLVYVNTLEQAETYLKREFNVNIKL